MHVAVTLFLCVVAVGLGLLVVTAAALIAWVTFGIVADVVQRKAGQ